MAIQDFTLGGTTKLPNDSKDKGFVISREIDFTDPAYAHASLDVLSVLNIPAGTFVLRAGHKVLTVEGATAAGTLGDGADPDGFVAASNLNALGVTLSAGVTVGYALGKLYTTADTLDYVATNGLDAAKVRFFAICFDVN